MVRMMLEKLISHTMVDTKQRVEIYGFLPRMSFKGLPVITRGVGTSFFVGTSTRGKQKLG